MWFQFQYSSFFGTRPGLFKRCYKRDLTKLIIYYIVSDFKYVYQTKVWKSNRSSCYGNIIEIIRIILDYR